jgi:hypothetical protein
MPNVNAGKFSSYPTFGIGRVQTVTRPSDEKATRLGRKKKKKDMAERLARMQEAQAELMARRSQMRPQGPQVDINPWNKS